MDLVQEPFPRFGSDAGERADVRDDSRMGRRRRQHRDQCKAAERSANHVNPPLQDYSMIPCRPANKKRARHGLSLFMDL